MSVVVTSYSVGGGHITQCLWWSHHTVSVVVTSYSVCGGHIIQCLWWSHHTVSVVVTSYSVCGGQNRIICTSHNISTNPTVVCAPDYTVHETSFYKDTINWDHSLLYCVWKCPYFGGFNCTHVNVRSFKRDRAVVSC